MANDFKPWSEFDTHTEKVLKEFETYSTDPVEPSDKVWMPKKLPEHPYIDFLNGDKDD